MVSGWRCILRLVLLVSASAATSAAWAGTVTVITSFPVELTKAYKIAFEKMHPHIKLEILNRGTTAGVAYIRQRPAGQRPDVFWASAPDAFEVLAKSDLLQRVADLSNREAPPTIGGFPLNDPNGYYLGQALSGYGLMWNKRYLAAKKLPPPAEWADLTKPIYMGHIGLSAPSHSGTTHLIVETILQGEGWDKGWRQLLQIAANCATITERSFGVPVGVGNGQFGIGIVVDFFGLASKYSGYPVEFSYPSMTTIVPSNIAVVAGAKNEAEARTFVQFAMSREGQKILLQPELSRLPILPLDRLDAPAGYPDAHEIAKKATVRFDSGLSAARYNLVTSLFDQTVTFHHQELSAAAKAIHAAEAALSRHPNPRGAALLSQARELTFKPVLAPATAGDKTFLAAFLADRTNAAASKEVTRLEGVWSSTAVSNYAKARSLAEEAAALAH